MKRSLAIVLAAAVGLAVATPALSGRNKKPAASEAAKPAATPPAAAREAGPHAGLVSYRHNLLEGVANHFKMSKAILMGKVSGRDADLVFHARAIHDSFADFTSMFPADTGPSAYPKTDALPAIWTDWAGFEERARAFRTESAKFLALAEAGDMVGAKAQFREVGGACGACHDTFRKED